MSRYVLTPDQLERLQEQIQELRRVNALKEERIRELELHKLRVSSSEVTDLLKTIASLEEDISELKKANRRLTAEAEAVKANTIKVKDLEILLQEERKLREYSETLAKQMEQRYNEEALLKELTTELCQLQKAEIEISNKRIEELQRKLRKYTNEVDNFHLKNENEIKQDLQNNQIKQVLREKGKETKNKQLKSIIQKLRGQMTKMYEDIERKPYKTEEDKRRLKELDKWFQEASFVMNDVNGIEELRKDLSYLRNEIENRRKSIVKFRS